MIEIPLTRRVSIRISCYDCFVSVHYHWEDESLTLACVPMVSVRLHLGSEPPPPAVELDHHAHSG